MNRQLLEKYFKNQSAPQEVRQILSWISSFNSEEEFSKEFQQLWERDSLPVNKNLDWQKAWQTLQDKIEMEEFIYSLPVGKKKEVDLNRNRQTKRLAIAAVVSLIIISMAAIYFFNEKTNRNTKVTATINPVQKSTEKGQKLTIHLEDGSKVMLNAQSDLSFPGQFSDSLREVWLQGEAYFDVVSNTQRPFKVHTGSITTTALGTSFNINAYPEKSDYRVALTQGKVVVAKENQNAKVFLEPGEMAVYRKQVDEMDSKTFAENEIAWKDGIIYFENASFSEIKAVLERWYGVEIFVNGDPDNRKWQFSGKFKNETLKNILEALKFTHDFNYQLERKTVYMNFI